MSNDENITTDVERLEDDDEVIKMNKAIHQLVLIDRKEIKSVSTIIYITHSNNNISKIDNKI